MQNPSLQLIYNSHIQILLKTWVKVLIIGIILLFIGMIMAGNAMMTKQFQYGGIGWILFFFGAILIMVSIIAVAKRLFRRMVND